MAPPLRIQVATPLLLQLDPLIREGIPRRITPTIAVQATEASGWACDITIQQGSAMSWKKTRGVEHRPAEQVRRAEGPINRRYLESGTPGSPITTHTMKRCFVVAYLHLTPNSALCILVWFIREHISCMHLLCVVFAPRATAVILASIYPSHSGDCSNPPANRQRVFTSLLDGGRISCSSIFSAAALLGSAQFSFWS
jgi:hypothetical protein